MRPAKPRPVSRLEPVPLDNHELALRLSGYPFVVADTEGQTPSMIRQQTFFSGYIEPLLQVEARHPEQVHRPG